MYWWLSKRVMLPCVARRGCTVGCKFRLWGFSVCGRLGRLSTPCGTRDGGGGCCSRSRILDAHARDF